MDGVVVEDQMEFKPPRHSIVNGLEKLAKLEGPMPLMQRPDHGAGFEVERREQVGRAVAQKVRRAPAAWPGRMGSTG